MEVSPEPVDYDKLASHYDRYRGAEGIYSGRIAALADEVRAQHALELGAGTGNGAASLLRRHPCRLVCIEKSVRMIRAGRTKTVNAPWIQADAQRLPLRDSEFDYVYSIFMLHHLRTLETLMRECARVLRAGIAAFVTTTHEFIRSHPMNAYFPSFAPTDLARFQPVEEVAASLRTAGFIRVECCILRSEPVPIDARYVEKVAARFISTYELIPRVEFVEGLSRLRRDVATGRPLGTIAWECACVWGYIE